MRRGGSKSGRRPGHKEGRLLYEPLLPNPAQGPPHQVAKNIPTSASGPPPPCLGPGRVEIMSPGLVVPRNGRTDVDTYAHSGAWSYSLWGIGRTYMTHMTGAVRFFLARLRPYRTGPRPGDRSLVCG